MACDHRDRWYRLPLSEVEPDFCCCTVPVRSQPSLRAEIWPRGATVYYRELGLRMIAVMMCFLAGSNPVIATVFCVAVFRSPWSLAQRAGVKYVDAITYRCPGSNSVTVAGPLVTTVLSPRGYLW